MTFYESNRKLVSSTGYLKSIDGSVCESPIYLGIYDNESNYTEASKGDYDAYLKSEEERAKLPPEELMNMIDQ